MALRFHGTEADAIPRSRILQGLHHMLDRPQLADLVIPDLARWEDWTQTERLVELFKNADDKSSWVRVPVINYLRACPQPEARGYIEELEKIDPQAVKRANTFFPFGGGASRPAGDETTSTRENAPRGARFTSTTTTTTSAHGPRSPAAGAPAGRAKDAATWAAETPWPYANPFSILCVMIIAGTVVMLTQWRILAGAGRNP
jgi:hypothetical protein